MVFVNMIPYYSIPWDLILQNTPRPELALDGPACKRGTILSQSIVRLGNQNLSSQAFTLLSFMPGTLFRLAGQMGAVWKQGDSGSLSTVDLLYADKSLNFMIT